MKLVVFKIKKILEFWVPPEEFYEFSIGFKIVPSFKASKIALEDTGDQLHIFHNFKAV